MKASRRTGAAVAIIGGAALTTSVMAKRLGELFGNRLLGKQTGRAILRAVSELQGVAGGGTGTPAVLPDNPVPAQPVRARCVDSWP